MMFTHTFVAKVMLVAEWKTASNDITKTADFPKQMKCQNFFCFFLVVICIIFIELKSPFIFFFFLKFRNN